MMFVSFTYAIIEVWNSVSEYYEQRLWWERPWLGWWCQHAELSYESMSCDNVKHFVTMNNVTIGWYCMRIVWTSPSGVVIRFVVSWSWKIAVHATSIYRWLYAEACEIRYDDCERIFHNIVSGHISDMCLRAWKLAIGTARLQNRQKCTVFGIKDCSCYCKSQKRTKIIKQS